MGGSSLLRGAEPPPANLPREVCWGLGSGETTEASPAPRLLPSAVLPHRQRQHCQGKPGAYQE